MKQGGQLAKTMSLPVSVGEGVSDQFPAGLRVLVVDDDPTCLMILEKMLRTCLYQVTKSNRAEKALSLLRENRNGYDIIISDVHMPDMNGFKLLEHVGLEMDLPVIMMSADDSKSVVMKGVTHGACDYLIKPVRMEALKNIWQHVVRRKRHEWKDNIQQTRSLDEGEHHQQSKGNDEVDYSSSANEGNNRNSKRRNDDEDESEEREDSSALKKPRVVWSVELHQQFMAAVDQLGVDKAVPKKILEMMNVPGLTRENVASHLQKYRLYLRRLSGVSHHQAGIGNSFMGQISSMNGLDLQALAASGHLPPQSLANLQAATLARSLPKSTIPILDQRNNIFSFENPSRFRETNNNINNMSSANKQGSLLHGIPTTMEPQQLANLRGINNMQQNPRINSNNNHFSRLSSLQKTGFSSNEVFTGNDLVGNVRGSSYNPLTQPSMVNFSANQGNNSVKDFVRNEVSSRAFDPSYDIFNDLAQHKTNDNWGLQNIGMNFESTPHVNLQSNSNSNGLNVQPSVLVQQGFSSGKNSFQNRNGNGGFFGESSMRVKLESNVENSGQNMPFADQFVQEDLLSALLKPKGGTEVVPHGFGFDAFSDNSCVQNGVGHGQNDFGFDGFPPLDNLPV